MKRSVPHRIGPVRGELSAPCAAAARSSLTGRTVAECHRMLARNHGRCPLDSAVTPAVLTSLDDLGFWHVPERHEPPRTFAAWAARAVPGAYLVAVSRHLLAATVIVAPAGRVETAGRRQRRGLHPLARAALAPLLALPVDESIRCEPLAERRAPAPTLQWPDHESSRRRRDPHAAAAARRAPGGTARPGRAPGTAQRQGVRGRWPGATATRRATWTCSSMRPRGLPPWPRAACPSTPGDSSTGPSTSSPSGACTPPCANGPSGKPSRCTSRESRRRTRQNVLPIRRPGPARHVGSPGVYTNRIQKAAP